jgi:tetratricopeptide (TPR) repeat protein
MLAFMTLRTVFFSIAMLLGLSAAQAAEDMTAALQSIEDRWATAHYEIKDRDARLAAVHALERDTQVLMAAHPASVETKVWYAFALLQESDIRHNASALPLVREARQILEDVADQPSTMQVDIYNALADLYTQVPGWPIAFGSDRKSEAYFAKTLALDPDGLYNNYLYGDFLAHHGRAREALAHYEIALKAPIRPDHAKLDSYRHKEVEEDVAALRRKLKL